MRLKRGSTGAVFTITVCLLLCTSASEAVAQKGLVGVKIRVFREDNAETVGVFQRVTADSLWYWTGENISVSAVPLASVMRIDVRERVGRGRNAWRWTKRAFLVGAVIGAVTCFDSESCKSSPNESDVETALYSAFFLGFGLAPLGALAGLIIPGYRWRTLPRPYIAVIKPSLRETRLAVITRF